MVLWALITNTWQHQGSQPSQPFLLTNAYFSKTSNSPKELPSSKLNPGHLRTGLWISSSKKVCRLPSKGSSTELLVETSWLMLWIPASVAQCISLLSHWPTLTTQQVLWYKWLRLAKVTGIPSSSSGYKSLHNFIFWVCSWGAKSKTSARGHTKVQHMWTWDTFR